MAYSAPVTPAKAGVQNLVKRLDSGDHAPVETGGRNDGIRLPRIRQDFWQHVYALVPWLLLLGLLGGCFGARGMTEIRSEPYPLIYQDDSLQRYGDKDDNVLIEVRRVTISHPLGNLAIHYRSFFPGGEIIRPGDLEEYLKIDGRNAYRVVFRTSYIRRRKILKTPAEAEKAPEGWTLRNVLDPLSGKSMPVLYGPVIPREKILYLVEGKGYLYYIFLRADGEAIDSARKKFEEFVTKGIDYK